MNDKRRPVGLILSAGFSSRMKDFKPLMKIGGRTPLQMLIESFSIAGIKDIFVVVGHNADKIRGYINEHFADKNINIVLNEKYADGMFTSVKAGIRAAAENGSGCVLMTPVDIPLIPPYVIKAAFKAHVPQPARLSMRLCRHWVRSLRKSPLPFTAPSPPIPAASSITTPRLTRTASLRH